MLRRRAGTTLWHPHTCQRPLIETESFVESLFQRIESGGPDALGEEEPSQPQQRAEPITTPTQTAFGYSPGTAATVAAAFAPPAAGGYDQRPQSYHHQPRPVASRSYSDDEEGATGEMSDRHFRHRGSNWERERHRSRSPAPGRGGERNGLSGRGGSTYRPYSHEGGMGSDRRTAAPPRRYEQRGGPAAGPYARGGGAVYGRRASGSVPPAPRSETRLVIDKIPPEFCTVVQVNEYFQRFGKIVGINVHPELQRANIEYSSKEEATAAYTSPDVIFGNRFVKVYRDQDPAAAAAPYGNRRFSGSPGGYASQFAPTAGGPSGSDVARPLPPLNETLQKKQEALRGMYELQRQRQELLVKYIGQQKELVQKLENKAIPDSERQELLKALRSIDQAIKITQGSSPGGNKPATEGTAMAVDSTEAGAEAPDKAPSDVASSSAITTPASQPHAPILRGGPVQRGRGAVLAAQASRRLDLRPTSLLMKPIPDRVGSDASSVKKLFEPYGEIKALGITEGNATVTFARRLDAEKALFYLPKTDLGEPFVLEWTNNPPPSSAADVTAMPSAEAGPYSTKAAPTESADSTTQRIDVQLDSNNSMMDDVIPLDSSPHDGH